MIPCSEDKWLPIEVCLKCVSTALMEANFLLDRVRGYNELVDTWSAEGTKVNMSRMRCSGNSNSSLPNWVLGILLGNTDEPHRTREGGDGRMGLWLLEIHSQNALLGCYLRQFNTTSWTQ
jgi:hypothetical protein